MNELEGRTADTVYNVKGSGHGEQQQPRQRALGEEGDFAVHASVYGKVQAEQDVTPNDQERRREEEDACGSPKPGWLATYVGYVPCVSICLC
jgi:hypothetical protein